MNVTKLYVPKMSNFGPTCKKKFFKYDFSIQIPQKSAWGYWLI